MAKQSDVTLTVEGFDGVMPTGVTITSQVGSIPTAIVDLAPGGTTVTQIKGVTSSLLSNTDAVKRQQDITIDISVNTYVNSEVGRKLKKLKFVGLFDGLTVGNVVGNNTYQAVVKNKAQVLLEVAIMAPGLHPASINIYKNPSWSSTIDPHGKEGKVIAWGGSIKNPEIFDNPPIKFYKKLLTHIVELQQGDWQSYTQLDKLTDGKIAFEAVFNDPKYKKALTTAQQLLSDLDITAVDGGSSQSTKIVLQNNDSMMNIFTRGPDILLENLMNFLSNMGCSLIFGNSKIFVVPVNSVINQEFTEPGPKQLHSEPNQAYPADYTGYTYSDVGYRDIKAVVVSTPEYIGGAYSGGLSYDRGFVATYVAPDDLSQASGVLVVQAHPWMCSSPTASLPAQEKTNDANKDLDEVENVMYSEDLDYDAALEKIRAAHNTANDNKNDEYKKVLDKIVTNYAETKFYQARYADRLGSITMDFNPDWVPGTSGTLYIRETKVFIAFYVNSVTHRVDMSPPNNGSAITIVNFCCGRSGSHPKGVDEDAYLGYNRGKEKGLQAAYIADIT